MISCIILSAGLSSRFGQPKALATINNQSAIKIIQETLLQTKISEIIIVLGAFIEDIKPHILNHTKIKVVYNKDYKFGQTSSFQAGLSAVDSHAEAVFLLPVDCAFVRASTVDALALHFKKSRPAVLVPTFCSRRGHPPIFSMDCRDEILHLSASVGLNHLFEQHQPVEIEINDPGITQSFNTPQELERILQK